ncbi:MAG: alpha/beta hydrolase family protein, partial [Nanobdellota archaeon]
ESKDFIGGGYCSETIDGGCGLSSGDTTWTFWGVGDFTEKGGPCLEGYETDVIKGQNGIVGFLCKGDKSLQKTDIDVIGGGYCSETVDGGCGLSSGDTTWTFWGVGDFTENDGPCLQGYETDVVKGKNGIVGFLCRSEDPQVGCHDSDGGRDTYEQGQVYGKPSSMYSDDYASDYCISPTKLREFYLGIACQIVYEDGNCADGCYYGACLKSCNDATDCDEPKVCKEGFCVREGCNETDGGRDYYNKGTVDGYNIYGNHIIETDYCIDEDLLVETYCSDENNFKRENKRCAGGCSDGACTRSDNDACQEFGQSYWCSDLAEWEDECQGEGLYFESDCGYCVSCQTQDVCFEYQNNEYATTYEGDSIPMNADTRIYYMGPEVSPEQFVGNAASCIESVWYYDGDTWYLYSPEMPEMSDLETIEPGKVYSILSTNSCTLYHPSPDEGSLATVEYCGNGCENGYCKTSAREETIVIEEQDARVKAIIDWPQNTGTVDVLLAYHGTAIHDEKIVPATKSIMAQTRELIDKDDLLIIGVAYPEEGMVVGDNIKESYAALWWTKNKASRELDVNIDEIYLFGHSQGAYLVTRLNTMAPTDGVIANAPGPLDLQYKCQDAEDNQKRSYNCNLLRRRYGSVYANPQPYEDRSLLSFTTGYRSPILFFQGMEDQNEVQLQRWPAFKRGVENCRDCAPHKLYEIQDAGHDAVFTDPQASSIVNQFID